MSIQQPSSPAQAALLRTWEAHIAAEFAQRSVEATMATMTAEPRVVHVGTMTGAFGGDALRRFYAEDFVPAHPPDASTTLLGRVIGDTCLIDQMLYRCTHSIEMPWLVPGVRPTGKALAFPLVVVVEFVGDKIDEERIYFDQASILAQLGLLDPERLPIVSTEPAELFAGAPIAPNALVARARAAQGGGAA